MLTKVLKITGVNTGTYITNSGLELQCWIGVKTKDFLMIDQAWAQATEAALKNEIRFLTPVLNWSWTGLEMILKWSWTGLEFQCWIGVNRVFLGGALTDWAIEAC